MKRILFNIAFAALVLGGCADMQWSKPGADAIAVSRDLDDCRSGALRRASPLGTGGRAREPQVSNERSPNPIGSNPAVTTNERFIAEHEDVRACMSERGYTLKRAN